MGDLVGLDHAGDLLLDELKMADGAIEGTALLRIAYTRFETGADQSRRASRYRIAAVVKARHSDAKTLPFLTQSVEGRHAHFLAVHPSRRASAHTKLTVDVASSHTGTVGLQNECRDPFVPIIGRAIGACEPQHGVRLGRH